MSGEHPIEARLACAKFRAWHRGTREADYIIGGYFDRYARSWNSEQVAWFEALLAQEDVDILAWVMGKEDAPKSFQGPMLDAMRALDYVEIR